MRPITLSLCILFLLPQMFSTAAAGAEFGVVSKSLDDPNFILVTQGCQNAAEQHGDKCTHIGCRGHADPRLQLKAFEKAVASKKFSGFAISVVLSDIMARAVSPLKNLPIITFDSPFSPEDKHLSRAYVGTDNLAFGRDLAGIAKTFRPKGGAIFLMGDLYDPNLALRIQGVRRELAGSESVSGENPLTGEGGWHESPRSPWASGDDSVRALAEIQVMLKSTRPDVFISVGHWPLLDPSLYRETLAPFLREIQARKPVMIFGVGEISPELSALMDQGIVHGLVSIDFYRIGLKVYDIMRALTERESVPKKVYIPNMIRIAGQSN